MTLTFNESISVSKTIVSNINSSNTNISVIPYINPTNEKDVNYSSLGLTWSIVEI